MRRADEILIRIMRRQLGVEPADRTFLASLSVEEARRTYDLARRHALVPFIGDAVGKDGTFGDEALKQQVRADTQALVQHFALQEYERKAMSRVFQEAGIDYIWLKGAVFAARYPVPWYRTRGDLDVLVREADIPRAVALLEERLGYQKENDGSHDVPFWTKSRVHVEVHFSLIEEDRLGTCDRPLAAVWEQAQPLNGHEYALPPELTYYYHIAHMAKHMLNGGCGVRAVADTWLLQPDRVAHAAACDALLREGGLYAFASAVEHLAAMWFAEATPDEMTEELAAYVIGGDVYGSNANRVAVQSVKYKSRWHRLWHLVFLPYRELWLRYPSLKNRPWLTPLYQMRRWGRIVTERRVKKQWSKWQVQQIVPEDTRTRTARLLQALELTK